MKQIKFTYTKDNGDESERQGIILHKPSLNYLIVDLSEYKDDVVELNFMLDQINQYKVELKQLQAKYSISSHCKAFKQANMTHIVYD